MPQILHTTLIGDRAIAAAGEEFTVDLPVNPLSGIILTMKALINDAGAVARNLAAQFAAKYTSWRVTYRGATIIQGQTEDLLLAMMLRERFAPGWGNLSRVNNDAVSLSFPLMFGGRLYDPMECFPATRRGDFRFTITSAADANQLDGHILQAETIELLDAKPSHFYKVTTISQAMAAIGRNDIELPIGNPLCGVLLRPFVFPTGASFNSSFGQITLAVDNVEIIENFRNFESAHGMLLRRIPPAWDLQEHAHGFADAAAGQTDTQPVSLWSTLQNAYAYLDWDPLGDKQYMVDEKGAAHLQLRMTSDTADGANTSRVLPIEYVDIGGPQAAAA